MSEPTTVAGRALLAWLNAVSGIVYATPDSILAIEAEARQQEPALDVERLAQAMHELHKGPCTRWQYPEHRASYMEDALTVAAEYARLATEDKP